MQSSSAAEVTILSSAYYVNTSLRNLLHAPSYDFLTPPVLRSAKCILITNFIPSDPLTLAVPHGTSFCTLSENVTMHSSSAAEVNILSYATHIT
jgi:hypothetical protein